MLLKPPCTRKLTLQKFSEDTKKSGKETSAADLKLLNAEWNVNIWTNMITQPFGLTTIYLQPFENLLRDSIEG